MKLYNTLSKSKEEFKPIKEEISIYTCGPTVYDYAHIGNFRAYLFGDLLFRYLKYRFQIPVKWIMNITDIDDKTIRNSKGEGDAMKNLKDYTRKYEEAFLEDLEKVRIPRASFVEMPRATEHIEQMQDLITKIYENGYAYIRDGSVYFSLESYTKDNQYGKLLNIDHEHFRAGVRIDQDEYEREQVSDFVLWKEKKEGEPSWKFTLDGQEIEGRPGWHIECSAMEKEYFDLPFDIHTGGVDLVFPHHEDEIAQSCGGFCQEPTRFWCHNEHLLVDGQKMSKSLGNFYTLRDLEEKGYELDDYRYVILAAHYRTKMSFSFNAMESAKQSRKKIINAYQLIQSKLENQSFGNADIVEEMHAHKASFEAAMDDDLNTSKALAVVFESLKIIFSHMEGEGMTQESYESAKGFLEIAESIFAIGIYSVDVVEIPNEIREMVAKRQTAKEQKNYELADTIRDQIQSKGFDVRDGKDGPEIFEYSL